MLHRFPKAVDILHQERKTVRPHSGIYRLRRPRTEPQEDDIHPTVDFQSVGGLVRINFGKDHSHSISGSMQDPFFQCEGVGGNIT